MDNLSGQISSVSESVDCLRDGVASVSIGIGSLQDNIYHASGGIDTILSFESSTSIRFPIQLNWVEKAQRSNFLFGFNAARLLVLLDDGQGSMTASAELDLSLNQVPSFSHHASFNPHGRCTSG